LQIDKEDQVQRIIASSYPHVSKKDQNSIMRAYTNLKEVDSDRIKLDRVRAKRILMGGK